MEKTFTKVRLDVGVAIVLVLAGIAAVVMGARFILHITSGGLTIDASAVLVGVPGIMMIVGGILTVGYARQIFGFRGR